MKPGNSLMKHYLQFKDFRAEEYAYLFERARLIKRRFKNYERYQPLADRTLAMIFEKASTRTRVSFEAGMYQLGGQALFLSNRDLQLGRGEGQQDGGDRHEELHGSTLRTTPAVDAMAPPRAVAGRRRVGRAAQRRSVNFTTLPGERTSPVLKSISPIVLT